MVAKFYPPVSLGSKVEMIGLVDYGMGNLRSVEKALERVGASVRRVARAGEEAGLSGLVVPGQGAFRDAVSQLHQTGLWDVLLQWLKSNRPFLGICLGQQVLFEKSYEGGEHAGLGWFSGTVERLSGPGLKVPQIGWNQVHSVGHPMFGGVQGDGYFYFDHSFAVRPALRDVVAGETEYGAPFASAVAQGNCWGVQFHPEKSQKLGLRLLENFVRLAES
jgi:glutamine amidotransferase